MPSIPVTPHSKQIYFCGTKNTIDTYIKIGALALLLLCILTRVFLYIFHKDLWLDEAMLFHAINETKWPDLLHGRLSHGQSAPLLFVLIHKLIISYLGTSVLYLYTFPLLCSLLSVLGLFLLSRKVGESFYVFSVMLFLSISFTATYYSAEFKQYSTEMCISVILLYTATSLLNSTVQEFLSLKYFFLYCICVLCSSSAVLFIAGIFCAQFIIAWRRKALLLFSKNTWKILLLLIFIILYYLFYLKSGDSAAMQSYWKRYYIPLGWEPFIDYWKTTGLEIFKALFYSSKLTFLFVLGLGGGSILLWHKKPEFFLLLSCPVLVTVTANFFFYPPGLEGAPRGGRLLLFLLPNALLVIGWFYAWVLKKFAALGGDGVEVQKDVSWLPPHARQILLLCMLCVLVAGSLVANGCYLYSREYYVEQTDELTQILQANRTPDSLILVYNFARCAYRYYQRNEPKHRIEILPLRLEPLKARLERLPKNRRILLLFSHNRLLGTAGLGALEELFESQGREIVRIPAKDAMLYILPKVN